MLDKFNFYPCEIKDWTGRYRRIQGNESTFHIRRRNTDEWWLVIDWITDEDNASCWAKYCIGVKNLVDAVVKGKKVLGGGMVVVYF